MAPIVPSPPTEHLVDRFEPWARRDNAPTDRVPPGVPAKAKLRHAPDRTPGGRAYTCRRQIGPDAENSGRTTALRGSPVAATPGSGPGDGGSNPPPAAAHALSVPRDR